MSNDSSAPQSADVSAAEPGKDGDATSTATPPEVVSGVVEVRATPSPSPLAEGGASPPASQTPAAATAGVRVISSEAAFQQLGRSFQELARTLQQAASPEAVSARLVSQLSPQVARVRSALEVEAQSLRALHEDLRRALEATRAQLSSVEARTAPDRLQAAIREGVAPTASFAERELEGLGRRIEELQTRLEGLRHFVTAEQLGPMLNQEALRVASEVYGPALRQRMGELSQAFEDADDRYGQIKRLIDSFGPGGLPVLRQENDALRASLERLQRDLEAARADATRAEAKLAEREREILQHSLVQGLPSLEELQKQHRDLEEKKARWSSIEALESERERIAMERDKLAAELDKWRSLGLQEEQRRNDAAELERLRAEVAQYEPELSRANTARRSEEQKRKQEERRVFELEQQLKAVQEAERLGQQRVQRIEELTKENEALAGRVEQLEGEAVVARRDGVAQAQRVDELQRELLRRREQESLLEAQWRARHEEDFKKEVDKYREQVRALARAEQERLSLERNEQLREAQAEVARLRQTESRSQQLTLQLKEAEAARAAAERSAATYEERFRATAEAIIQDARERAQRLVSAAEGEKTSVQEAVQGLRNERARLEVALAELAGRKGVAEEELQRVQRRLNSLEDKALPRQERLQKLYQPVVPTEELLPVRPQVAELEWLEQVEEGIRAAGFAFHPRLIRAFHTSLKVARSSPLTVLAGISGTGKSELPRLYADLGGLSFLPIAVQPSWDSPSDLFGFFNYTDGRLHAEPLARLLRQVNDKENPLGEGLSIVLLDEMNLARVEYYFAELLSKLEARRSVRGTSEADRARASISVSAGAGEEEVRLYLNERVLFVGTMNDDESTQTLTDKVLDRSSVLSFPSPRDMKLNRQPAVVRAPQRLAFSTWTSWCTERDVPEIGERLNQLNGVMEKLDRPFGHRLFRAIHAYIANYPDATKTADAWSDQWAMKVLPRLKGLECDDTRVREGFDKLGRLMPEELQEAFTKAREKPYFAWTGAADLFRPHD